MGGKSNLAKRTVVAIVAGAGGALLAPAGLLAAGDPPPPAQPQASIAAAPTPAVAGQPVTLDASRSSEPGGQIVRYLWDLDGNGSYETDTGSRPSAVVTLAAPGTVHMGLRAEDANGAHGDAALDLPVVAAGAPAASASGAGATVPAPAAGGAGTSAAPPKRHAAVHHRRAQRHHSRPVRAVAAASGGVTIKNFAFGPHTITVNVGDSITWTNQDSAAHTATANDGSFNTGQLKQGQSGSHTFTKAGTFAYICAIHPNMHGTVVVTGASAGGGSSSSGGGGASSSGSSGSSGSGSASGSSAGTGAAASGSSGTLPRTGFELLVTILLGAGMALGGAVLRRLAGSRS